MDGRTHNQETAADVLFHDQTSQTWSMSTTQVTPRLEECAEGTGGSSDDGCRTQSYSKVREKDREKLERYHGPSGSTPSRSNT